MEKLRTKILPDVAMESKSRVSGTIDRVGMTQIEVPLLLEIDGKEFRIPARASAFVSLDKSEVKGIHMSRLFSVLQVLSDKHLSSEILEKTVKDFQLSHKDISESSELELDFEVIQSRASLVSNMKGWRHYPAHIRVINEKGTLHWEVGFQVTYSSTCPCSAALARQLIQERFQKEFSKKAKLKHEDIYDWFMKEESICATPHSQRSFATVTIQFKQRPKDILKSLLGLIVNVEASLKTPVQSFVKRNDEQEFARLNAENLMFCEDAAREIRSCLQKNSEISKFSIEVEHQESLHPHNAVARVSV